MYTGDSGHNLVWWRFMKKVRKNTGVQTVVKNMFDPNNCYGDGCLGISSFQWWNPEFNSLSRSKVILKCLWPLNSEMNMKKARDSGRSIISGNGRGFTGHGREGLRDWPYGEEKLPAPRIADSSNWRITNIVAKKYKKANERASLLASYLRVMSFPSVNIGLVMTVIFKKL
jgi:hypothetical protein